MARQVRGRGNEAAVAPLRSGPGHVSSNCLGVAAARGPGEQGVFLTAYEK